METEAIDVHAPVIVPYTYREYPRMMYGANGATVVVNSDEEKDALGQGWSQTPPSIPTEAAAKGPKKAK